MTGRVAAVLVVPHGTHRPEPLAEAIRVLHVAWEVGAIWCGDPQLRPRLDGVAWLDEQTTAATDELAIVAGEARIGEWRRAVGVAVALLAAGADQVVLLWVGSTAVLSGIEVLVADRTQPMMLVPRTHDPIPDDGLAPTENDVVADGVCSTSIAVFGRAAAPALTWLASNLTGSVSVGTLLSRAAQLFGAQVCPDETIGVGRWRWNCREPALLDVDRYDARSPWTLDPDATGPMRIELLGNASRREAMLRATPQLGGERTPLLLPGGLTVDETIRRVVADAMALASSSTPAPWSAAAEFRAWLAPRYWFSLHDRRRDLWIAFPDPKGRSAADFRRWCRGAFAFDEAPFLLTAAEPEHSEVVVADHLRSDGVNLVGYLNSALGLGDVARRIREALDKADVPVSTIATQRTASPDHDAEAIGNRVEFTNSLCVVTADQFPFLSGDFPELFATTRRMIGYWFWELEHVPLHMRQSIALVDEIWAGSRFVTDAFAAVSPVPVRHVPIPIAEPRASDRDRPDFAVLADLGKRPVFLTVFDHLSVTERKNPLGVIEAFRRAFSPNEGPVLIIKTMNGAQRRPNHQRVLAAADGRDDIRVWDETLERADQMALVACVDCMISLHRSEGLGLHLAEAMWLRTPTIATRYSGNLDFMNDSNSILINAELVHVEHGEGVYPSTAKWAEPDLDEAVAAMHRIVGDTPLAKRLAAAGRHTMTRQPSLAETGSLISHLLFGGE
jgi:glycosyltransferase involved in cell wall biosynthesis